MKRHIAGSLSISFWVLLSALCRADDVKTASEDIPVQYVEVADAFQQLRNSFPETIEVVESLQLTKNSLTINPAHAKAAELRKRLAEIDVRSRQILISAEISEVTEGATKGSTKEKVLSRPTIFCRDGEPVTISTGIGEKNLKIKLTARAIRDLAKK